MAGDSLDFWRVLYADKEEKQLLLFAEMKLPGEAWLEFKIKDKNALSNGHFPSIGIMGQNLLVFSIAVSFHNL